MDSAVAAALAVEAGHDVVGVHMALSRNRDQFRTGSRGCCSIEDAGDARRAADVLGIPYYVWDLSERFEDTVVADFLSEYEAGRTPNPCVRCNEHIKFEALLDKATALGFDAVATGHYAQIVTREVALPDGGLRTVRELHRSPNDAKDQSYVLAVAGAERLARAMFPLGGFASKDEVRAEAARRGLSVSAKPDSYDICFVADGDTRGFLQSRLGSRPGSVVDTAGEVVGEHDGAYAFTVGQRRGLALGRPAADGKARYVVDVQPATNTVVVGPAELLSVDRIAGEKALWFDGVLPTPPAPLVEPTSLVEPVETRHTPLVEPVETRHTPPTPPAPLVEPVETPADVAPDPDGWFDAEVQVRAHGAPVPARVRSIASPGDAYGDDVPEGERSPSADGSCRPANAMEIELTGAPLRGVAPGQSVVVYRGTRVLGQATVSRAWRAPAPR